MEDLEININNFNKLSFENKVNSINLLLRIYNSNYCFYKVNLNDYEKKQKQRKKEIKIYYNIITKYKCFKINMLNYII